MSGTPVARLGALASRLLMAVAVALLRQRHAGWGRAMQAEMATLDDGHGALAFAWGCCCTALREVGSHAWALARTWRRDAFALLCCAGAVAAGALHMHTAGAPRHWPWMNLLSLGVAVAVFVAVFVALPRQRWRENTLLRARLAAVLGAVLLITSLGPGDTGQAAWLRLGPVAMNLAWLLLPALLVAADGRPASPAGPWACAALLCASMALIVLGEPVLLAVTAVVQALRAFQYRHGGMALLAAASASIAATLGTGWPPMETQAFVDRVVSAGFNQDPALGAALLLVQLLPALAGLRARASRMHGLVWALLVLCALPGWLPSPLLGYGGSFIAGYLLSLALTPGDAHSHAAPGAPSAPAPRAHGAGPPSDRGPHQHPTPPRPRSGLA